MSRVREKKWWKEKKARGICAYCGDKVKHLTHDHVIPLSKGGTNREHNIVFCCADCNLRKGSMDLDSFLVGRFANG